MINALKLAMEIDRLLPSDEVPEKSEGYEGFFYLCDLNGSVDKVSMTYCIRDHDAENFNKRKQLLKDVCERVEILHKGAKIDCRIIDQYRNMKEQVEPYPHIITIAKQAMEQCGVTPKVKPIRGGTDGATLSFKGLPCPNLFAGGLNFHGVYEYIPVKSMELATQVLIEIAKLVVK
jgi:tripeptide aminopeptidase